MGSPSAGQVVDAGVWRAPIVTAAMAEADPCGAQVTRREYLVRGKAHAQIGRAHV